MTDPKFIAVVVTALSNLAVRAKRERKPDAAHLMEFLATSFKSIRDEGSSAARCVTIGSVVRDALISDRLYGRSAVAVQRLALLNWSAAKCTARSVLLPEPYRRAVDKCCFFTIENACVTWQFARRAAGQVSELDGWLVGPWSGSVDVFENELMSADILIQQFGLPEEAVRYTLGFQNTFRDEFYRLVVASGGTVAGRFAPTDEV